MAPNTFSSAILYYTSVQNNVLRTENYKTKSTLKSLKMFYILYIKYLAKI